MADLRVLARSGQGLTGQSEELGELLTKILKDELAEGSVAKVQDDLIIGGDSQREAAHIYMSYPQTALGQPEGGTGENQYIS